MSGSVPIKVSVVDDHPLAISGVENMLRPFKHIEIISTYTSGALLLEGLTKVQPDVLLLDILLPDQSGQDLAEIISKTYPKVNILALTSLDAPSHVKGMMRRGCKGYLLKNTDQDTLVTAIEKVYNGEEYIEASLKEQMLHNIIKGKREHLSNPKIVLTEREKEILTLIVNEHTSKEIADKLFLSLRTVEGHRLNLLQKLDAKNTVGLVRIAMQMGLID